MRMIKNENFEDEFEKSSIYLDDGSASGDNFMFEGM